MQLRVAPFSCRFAEQVLNRQPPIKHEVVSVL